VHNKSVPERGRDDASVGQVVAARHEDMPLILVATPRGGVLDGQRPAIHLHLGRVVLKEERERKKQRESGKERGRQRERVGDRGETYDQQKRRERRKRERERRARGTEREKGKKNFFEVTCTSAE